MGGGADVEVIGLGGEPRLPEWVERRSAVELGAACDVALALGGDGTMLGALRLAAPAGTPVLGVNLGTLGYLAELDAAHLDQGLLALQSGAYRVEARTAVALNPGHDAGGARITRRGQSRAGAAGRLASLADYDFAGHVR